MLCQILSDQEPPTAHPWHNGNIQGRFGSKRYHTADRLRRVRSMPLYAGERAIVPFQNVFIAVSS